MTFHQMLHGSKTTCDRPCFLELQSNYYRKGLFLPHASSSVHSPLQTQLCTDFQELNHLSCVQRFYSFFRFMAIPIFLI